MILRLLDRTHEMSDVYAELENKFSTLQSERILEIIVSVAAFWNAEEAIKLRNQRRSLIDLNDKIASVANNLSELISERQKVAEESGLFAYDDCHPIDWIEHAAKDHHLFQGWIKEKLDYLTGRFDLKYWPETYEVVKSIGDFARENQVLTTHNWTEALISSRKSSWVDVLRALLCALNDEHVYAPLRDFKPVQISDKSLATIINCSLHMPPEETIDETMIKNARQRMRNGNPKVTT